MIVTPIIPNPPYPQCIVGPQDILGQGRSQHTLHLSDILGDMASTLGRYGNSEISQEDLEFYGANGFLWERVWSEAHRDSVESGDLVRIGELERDGIVGSPDLIRLSTWTLLELKCRWMSSRKFDSLEKHFYWEIRQVLGYLAMMDGLTAELHVMFVNGTWRPPIPTVKSVRLEFTQREVDENWSVIVGHAKRKGWL